jgi:hypothetical protein
VRACRSPARAGIAALVAVVLGVPAAPAGAQPIVPFVEPPFASECVVHRFAEGLEPPLDGCGDDPLCVEYEKRDITATNGGAIRFLAAEPARFAAAIPKCRYWQQDHWRIQVAPGATSVVGWDGSYWFNKGNGTGGARLRNFTINGVPADPAPVADLVALVAPDLAAVIRRYGESPGGGGGSGFILGAGDPTCAAPPDARCTEDPAVPAIRAAADERCGCAGPQTRAAYLRCVGRVADEAVAAGRLPAECKSTVARCARESICARPAAVTCCRTNARGEVSCNVTRNAAACRAPRGGTATVGSRASCCEPCSVAGCR